MNHIKILHDASAVVNWQLYPQSTPGGGAWLDGMAPNSVLVLVGRDVAPIVEEIRQYPPRAPYVKHCVVLPGDVTKPQAQAVFDANFDRRRSVIYSYDDAAAFYGYLPDITAELIGISADRRQAFVDWYAGNYPGVKVVFA